MDRVNSILAWSNSFLCVGSSVISERSCSSVLPSFKRGLRARSW